MINLLEQIRSALDELEPRLTGRVVDVEMPRLFVVADEVTLRAALVGLIGHGLDSYAGDITVRTSKQHGAASIEVSGDQRAPGSTGVAEWSDRVLRAAEAFGGTIANDGPVGRLTVPLGDGNTAE